ncbi:GlxA family transcriptional regulator [Burkholderia multivorans]|uniref:GlxA family transcriptional regulator n=1 Tax=Burkholderia multivorans TaxID=87883 RepID=UPI001C23E1FE|nr:helix-turn-helix domain-containing protein [Burkholderia multivorans]MBU9477057.1 helix-turn-helix domain-containing protein [Burkholderia multivorans]
MHSVGLFVCSNFEVLELAVGTVFNFANLASGQSNYEVCFVSEHGGEIQSSLGISVHTTRLRARTFDTLIVMGNSERPPPTKSLLDLLAAAPSFSARVASIYSGTFALAEAGLLDGKRATTHWSLAQIFRNRFPKVKLEEDQILVVDGQIWTSAGMTSGIDLALALVEEDLGGKIARLVARQLLIYQRRGRGQSQFSSPPEVYAQSARVQLALAYAKEHLRQNLLVESLAVVAKLSPRQFSRVFREETGQSPAKAIERLRVEAARTMLETSQNSLEFIAHETGFGDRLRMRQAFIRVFGQSPQVIRRLSAPPKATRSPSVCRTD